MSATSSQGRRKPASPLEQALKTDAAGAARMLQDSFEVLVDQGAAGTVEGLDCRAGCSHCCHQLVLVRAPEIFRLARAIRALEPERADAIARRIVATDRVTRGRGVADRARDGIACPLLGPDGGCSMYEERPLPCRVFVSFDVKACKRLMAGLGDGGVPVPAGRTEAGGSLLTAYDGTCRAIGVDAQPYELVAGLAIALTVADAEAAWMKGRDVLAPARGPTKTIGGANQATVRL